MEKLKSGIIYQVPTGIIFNNGLLSNIGPKIPVKLSLIGDVTIDIKTTIKDYGINNAVIQVSINVKVTEQTFNAAAILLSMGADMIIKQNLLKESKREYLRISRRCAFRATAVLIK